MYVNLLAPGGYGLYSGLTRLQVSAEDHEANGVKIHNLLDIVRDRQMYIIQRPIET